MTLAARTRLGPYEILAPIGAGGMGEVYRARDTRLSRDVALKMLVVEAGRDAERFRRFRKEAESTAALSHPNIVTVFDVGEEDAVPFIVSELVSGGTLRDLLNRGPVPIRKLLELSAGIADGLAAAHAAGVVHRDLKPENVLLTPEGLPKIADFGLAKYFQPGPDPDGAQLATLPEESTREGAILGTVGYMSPEQASGKPLDFRSDQFALGSILYEMATGKRAFQRETKAETLAAVIREEPQPFGSPTVIPAPLRWIVERCLAKEPRERYASTQDLARELRGLREHISEISSATHEGPIPMRRRGRRVMALLAAAGLLAAIASVSFLAGRRARSGPPTFEQLTFRRGFPMTARFAPDGETIIYGAAWDGKPLELFSTRRGSTDSRSLGISAAKIFSISATGEMAILVHDDWNLRSNPVLARVPLAGGSPKEVLQDVFDADWGPEGKSLAVLRSIAGLCRLEYPIGRTLRESANLRFVRVSPEGDRIALVENTAAGAPGPIKVIDRAGKELWTSRPLDVTGLAWKPPGGELWYSGEQPGRPPGTAGSMIGAFSTTGKERFVYRSPIELALQDLSSRGDVLLIGRQFRLGIAALPPGETREADLSWLDSSALAGLTRDGKTLLISEVAVGGGSHGSVYVRGMDGSSAARLGDGFASGFTSDGRWALAIENDGLFLLPLGPGEPKHPIFPELRAVFRAKSFPDGKRLLIYGSEAGHGARNYVGELTGGSVKPVQPEGVNKGVTISPDGRFVTGAEGGQVFLYPVEGGEPGAIPGLRPDELPVEWSADGRSLYVRRFGETPARIWLVDVRSGARRLWRELALGDPAGLLPGGGIEITPDGQTYAYGYRRLLGDLYVASGLH